MKINLFSPDKETLSLKNYPEPQIIAKDLNLQLIFEQCSRDFEDGNDRAVVKDDFVRDTMRKVLLSPVISTETILYRQEIIKEAVKKPKFMKTLYNISTRAERDIAEYLGASDKLKNVSMIAIEKTKYLRKLTGYLDEIKTAIELEKPEGVLKDAFTELLEEYNDEFIEVTHSVLEDLEFVTSGGRIILGSGDVFGFKTDRYFVEKIEVLEYKERKKPKSETFAKVKAVANSLINPEVKELKDETLIADARALEDAACAHILGYYDDFIKNTGSSLKNLRPAMAFYLGCIRLYERMDRAGVPLCYPEVSENNTLEFDDLCETCLCIYNRRKPVGNSLDSKAKKTILVTGANQGGKSTYLRSIGLAQVFMQAGMFVTAQSYKSGLYGDIFTHFTRREDSTMNSGRLDEELKRMSQIVDRLTSDSLVLLNESFATTTEKEGSAIAMDLTKALRNTDIVMISVTHLLEYVNEAYEEFRDDIVFLSAGRRPDGTRNYKITENKPENTSYGLDLYDAVIK